MQPTARASRLHLTERAGGEVTPLWKGDLLWAALSAVIFFFASRKAALHFSTARLLLHVVSFHGANVLIVALLLFRPLLYTRFRTPLLAFVKLQRTAVASYVYRPYYSTLGVMQPTDERRGSLLINLLAKSFVLLTSSMGFPLPIRVHLVVSTLVLAVGLATNPRRCALECSAPWVQQYYGRLVQKLDAAFAFPLAPPTKSGLPAEGGPDPCVAVQTFLQIVLGYIVPLVLIDSTQSEQVVWHVPRAGGSEQVLRLSRQPALVQLLLNVGQVGLAGAVVWHGLRLMLGGAQR